MSVFYEDCYGQQDGATKWVNVFTLKSANVSTNVSDMESDNLLLIYPNPVFNELKIYISQNRVIQNGYAVTIYDLNGKRIKDIELSGSYNKIDISNLSRGTYLISIEIGEQIINRKFTKQQ